MADTLMKNVSEGFDLEAMAQEIKENFTAKGFTVNVMKMKNGVRLKFDKKCGGINMLLGLGQGITATCMLQGKERDNLVVNYSDGDWTGKIIGLIAGWCLCWVPIINAIIGCIKQSSLPKEINEAIMAIACEE